MRTPYKAALVLGTTGALMAGGIATASAGEASLSPGIRVVGLTSNGSITSVDTGRERASTPKAIRGLGARDTVVGIDYRPATNKLFGVARATNGNLKVFKISPRTGRAYNPKWLTNPAGDRIRTSATRFGVDFNPTVDRLRVVSSGGDNLRVDVRNGSTTVDSNLRFATGSGSPRVSAVAYTNSAAGATATELYDLEQTTNRIHTQAPPNDGVLNRGPRLNREIRATTGFDIATSGSTNTALVSNTSRGQTKIYRINLNNGNVAATANISGRSIVDIAAPTGR